MRRRLLALGAWEGWARLTGVATAVAAIGALWYTGQGQRSAQDQFDLAQQGQYTERFGRAVEQLGSPTIDVRIGGIASLTRLGRDSPYDRTSIVPVLNAFARIHGRVPTESDHLPFLTCNPAVTSRTKPDDIDQLEAFPPTADVAAAAAAVTALASLNDSVDFHGLCLDKLAGSNTTLTDGNLSFASLVEADLAGADLNRADLRATNLTSASMDGGSFSHTDLSLAKLYYASIRGASLSGVNLTGADLQGADLTGADLSGANFGSGEDAANLAAANLTGANLTGADLSGVDVTETILSGARGLKK